MAANDRGGRFSGLPRKLDRDPLVIGSDEWKALVRVFGAEPVHVVVSFARDGFEEGQWWIEDRSESGTLLNGERLAGKTRLFNGDSIAVADANILFSNGWLREDHRQAKGVRVDVRGLSDSRGGRAILRSVSFTAGEGEFIGILGPSGCGKSSVIQRIAGLAGFDSGSIAVNGHPASGDDTTLRRLVAYLPQHVEDALHGGLTPRSEMASARRIFLAPSADDKTLDAATLRTLGLSDQSQRLVGTMSGGEKRRVAIALALLREPQLLLLDEPTAGLDPATETETMEYLRRLAGQGRTVVCATHVMENIEKFDKVLVLAGGENDNGSAVYFGPPGGVLAHFGVASYPEMYARLKAGSCDGSAVTAEDPVPEPWELPEPLAQATFGRAVLGYLQRSFDEFCAAFHRSGPWLGRLFPAPVRTMLVQPVLMALGIKCACSERFGEISLETGGGVSTVLFCAALSVFWLGLVGNVQGLVRERVPRRCLERLGGVSLARYGVAKLITVLCPCLIQTLLFSALLFALPELGRVSHPSLLTASFGVCGVLFLVCLTGGLIGTAISACARNATAAVGLVPAVAVLALFFSQPVIGFNMSDRSEYGAAEKIAEWMPCYRPQVYMGRMLETQKCEQREREARWWFLGLFAAYAMGSVGLALAAQQWNERAWDGR